MILHRRCHLVRLPALVLFPVLLAAGILATPVTAQIESGGFPSVQLDPTARLSALGGRSPAITGKGAGSLFINPALLHKSDHGSVDVSYLNHVSDINAGWASYSRHLDGIGSAAAGIRYLSFGDFERADDAGNVNGTFSASDFSLTAGLSRPYQSSFRYGAAINVLHSSIDAEGATALALDLGGVYHADSSSMTFAASIHNLGLVLSSIGAQNDELPFDIRLGVTRRLAHLPLLVSLTAYRLDDLDGGPSESSAVESVLYHMIIAGEFQFSESFQVRFGYNQRRHDELKIKSRLDLAGFSTGVGIQISRVGVDYAFNSWSSLGGLHRFSVRTTL